MVPCAANVREKLHRQCVREGLNLRSMSFLKRVGARPPLLGAAAYGLAATLLTDVACIGSCPVAVSVPDQPFTANLRGNGITLDATPASWAALCAARCGAGSTACTVHVTTCTCNGPNTWIRCDGGRGDRTNGATDGFDTASWVSACQSACGAEQNCLMGVDPANQGRPTTRCVSWHANCTEY